MSYVGVYHPSDPICTIGDAQAWDPAFTADALKDVRVEQVDAERWDLFASGFADVNQEQTHCFSAAKWGPERVERAVVRQGNKIIGGAVVVVLAIPGNARAMSLVKWGPLWRPLGAQADPSRLRTVLRALKHEYAERRGNYLSVFPHADPEYTDDTCDMLRELGFRPYWSHNDPDRYLVNVEISPDELRSSLDQKWRYNLKKSAANDLEIVEVSPHEGMETFMTLYNQMLARKGFYDSSAIETLPALIQSNVPVLRPRIFLVLHEGTPTAGAIIDMSGERAVYLYGATDERALGLKAGYAMHWWIAEQLCQDPDIRWYDLGGKDGDGGLHQFKKGFVGKKGTIMPTPPSFDFAPTNACRVLGQAIFALRDAKAAVENLLYRAGVM